MMNVRRFFRGSRRYTLAAAVIVLTIFILGILSGRMIAAKNANKLSIMQEKNTATAEKIQQLFSEREAMLKNTHTAFVNAYNQSGKDGVPARYTMLTTLPEAGCSFSIMINDSIAAWRGDAPVKHSADLPYLDGRFSFYKSPLRVYGSIASKVVSGTDTVLLITCLPFEDRSALGGSNRTDVSFQAMLEELFSTEIIADYTPYKNPIKDGRYQSVALTASAGNKVGQITFKRISINSEIEEFSRMIANMQGLLIIAGYILLGFAVSGDFKALRYPLLKPVLFVLYCVVFRVLLFKLNLPSSLLSGELVEPAGFASQLGGGIVKSPIEFFITTAFFFAASVYVYNALGKAVENYRPHLQKRAGYIFYSAIPLYLLILFLSVRGIAASVKSVIYDSTFRYFNEPVIIPPLPQLIMVTGVLILATAVLLLLALFFRALLRFAPSVYASGVIWFVVLFCIISLSLGTIFIKVQDDPLISYPVFGLLLILLHILFYIAAFRSRPLLPMVLICGLFGSVSGVGLLNYFNSELERESLKTTIAEINRPGIEFLHFLAGEAIAKAESSETLLDAYNSGRGNMDAEAFLLWNSSALKQERVQSALVLLDKSKNIVGSFSTDEGVLQSVPAQFYSSSITTRQILPLETGSQSSRLQIAGISPVRDDNIVLGYLVVALFYQQGLLAEQHDEGLFKSSPTLINNLLSPADLNIFSVHDVEAENIYGDFYPTLAQLEALQSGVAKGNGEAWAEFVFNNENYVVFAQRAAEGTQGVLTAVALKEKKLEWSFFNFFKLFTVHALLIAIVGIIGGIISVFRRGALFITFRMQLLTAFLVVSILPVIALAVFNRYATYDKAKISTRAALQAKIAAVEKQIHQIETIENNNSDARLLLEKSGVSCNIYIANQLQSSAAPYAYTTGLMPSLLAYDADYNMNTAGLKEYFSSAAYAGREYFSLYKKVRINGTVCIVEANSLLNPIPGQYTPVEADVFLFGIYSLAVLLIAGLSSLIANRISHPIKQLILATRSVAHGDLSVKLENNAHGEIKELMSGFNTMTDELQRNQAELANLEREAAWKEFARQVAHEVKNPLTPMKLTMQQLVAAHNDKSPKFEAIFDKVSSTILHQIETLNAIASEFSSFARMPVINIEEVAIIPLLHESVTLFQNEKVTITVQEDVPAQLTVTGDTSHFRRMFINFFRNSIQAGATVISVHVQTVTDMISIRISDNGHGISPEHSQKIFDANFTTKAGGMGLGLKLSKRFIESLGGSITLEQLDSGACFIIQLPQGSRK